jgi:2-methylaconitate cis-trans-isomerase PrpF
MQVEMEVDPSEEQPALKKAVFARTARRILEGYVYVRISQVRAGMAKQE